MESVSASRKLTRRPSLLESRIRKAAWNPQTFVNGPNTRHEYVMELHGYFFRKWRFRWYVLEGKTLTVYEYKNDSRIVETPMGQETLHKPKHTFELKEAGSSVEVYHPTANPLEHFYLKLTIRAVGLSHTMYFKVQKEEEQFAWLVALRNAIALPEHEEGMSYFKRIAAVLGDGHHGPHDSKEDPVKEG